MIFRFHVKFRGCNLFISSWVVVSNSFYFHPEPWGRWTQFDEHIFQMGWFNHQLVFFWKSSPFLGHGFEHLWYLLMATRHPAFHSPVENMVCISHYLRRVCIHVRWLFGISEPPTVCPLMLGRHWLKDGENRIQIWVGTPQKEGMVEPQDMKKLQTTIG